MIIQAALTAAYAAIFVYLIRRSDFFRIAGLPSSFPSIVFIVKILAGISLGLVYTYYYKNLNGSDTFKFFRDSGILFDTIHTAPYDFVRMFTGIGGKSPDLHHYYVSMESWLTDDVIFNDNKTMVRLNTLFRFLFRFFSMGNYYVHVVFINLISFTGLMCMYRAFAGFCKGRERELALGVFLLPSVVFWGSGVLKDGVLLFALGFFFYSFNRLLDSPGKRRMIMAVISIFFLMFIKLYVLVMIFPAIIAWIISRKSSPGRMLLTFLALYTVSFIGAFNLYRFNDDFNIAALLYWKQHNFYNIGIWNDATMIEIPRLEVGVASVLKVAPLAFLVTLFRPFITDAGGNPLILMAALENMFLLLLLAVVFLFFLKRSRVTPFILLCICFMVFLFTLIGMITPVLGAMVRYKVPALPVLMFLAVYFYDKEKAGRKIKS
jgi:hypothetical protein